MFRFFTTLTKQYNKFRVPVMHFSLGVGASSLAHLSIQRGPKKKHKEFLKTTEEFMEFAPKALEKSNTPTSKR